jgi:hypothetical protein
MTREDGRALRQALEDALAAGCVVLTSSNSSDAHHPVVHAAHGQDGGSSPAPSTARIDLSTHHENGRARCIDSPAECGDRYLVNARMSAKAGEHRAEQAWVHSMLRRTNLKISSKYP